MKEKKKSVTMIEHSLSVSCVFFVKEMEEMDESGKIEQRTD